MVTASSALPAGHAVTPTRQMMARVEDAGYQFSRAHKRIHDLFIKRVSDYRARYAAGEDVAGELQELLSRWLFSHIKEEDASYVGSVRAQMQSLASDRSSGGWLSRSMKRFFGRSEAAKAAAQAKKTG